MISVIMPCYNASLYLPQAIESILWQTYKEFELIIINDGSTDNSFEIIEKYKALDSRIAPIHQTNSGIVNSLNIGLKHSSFEFIARMDADDISLPHRLSEQLSFLTKHPDVVLVGSRTNVIDPNGRFLYTTDHPINECDLISRMEKECAISHPTVFARKDVITSLGGYDARAIHAEDYDLWLRLLPRGRLCNLKDPVLLYREHSGSTSLKNYPQQLVSAFVAQELHQMLKRGLNITYPACAYSLQGLLTLPVSQDRIEAFSSFWISKLLDMHTRGRLSAEIILNEVRAHAEYLRFPPKRLSQITPSVISYEKNTGHSLFEYIKTGGETDLVPSAVRV